jgi:outer membrane protein assembly factor BamD (BamD/ComL family)
MGFEPGLQSSKVELANDFRDQMKGALGEAKAALAKAKDKMAKYYNRHRTPVPVFERGEKIFLDMSDIQTD